MMRKVSILYTEKSSILLQRRMQSSWMRVMKKIFLHSASQMMTMNLWSDPSTPTGACTRPRGPSAGWTSTTPGRARTGGSRGRWRPRTRRSETRNARREMKPLGILSAMSGNVIRELQNIVKNFKRRLQRIKGRLKSFKRNKEKREKKLLEASDQNAFGMNDMEEQLKQLEGQYTDSDEDSEDLENELGDEDDDDDVDDKTLDSEESEELVNDLYCVVCDKMFKTLGAKEKCERSKKHKENLDKLIEEMEAEENNHNELSASDEDNYSEIKSD